MISAVFLSLFLISSTACAVFSAVVLASVCNSEGVAYGAEVRGVLSLQDERQCAADDVADDVCRIDWLPLRSIRCSTS